MTLQKNVKSRVFVDFQKKRKKRILELCLQVVRSYNNIGLLSSRHDTAPRYLQDVIEPVAVTSRRHLQSTLDMLVPLAVVVVRVTIADRAKSFCSHGTSCMESVFLNSSPTANPLLHVTTLSVLVVPIVYRILAPLDNIPRRTYFHCHFRARHIKLIAPL